MAHMIAGFPDDGTDMEVARALVDGGADYIEIQFPFSDPSADGEAIQSACMKALQSGFRIDNGFELVRRITKNARVPVFIMSYASVVFARGIRKFVKDAAGCGAAGLIIPDLVTGHDEGLFQIGREEGIEVVPVVPPTLCNARLKEILAQNPAYLYASLRVGITGSRTDIDTDVYSFLEKLKNAGRRVFAGFGLQTRDQVNRLAGHADTLIIGSEIVKTISAALERDGAVYYSVRSKIISLLEDEKIVETEKTQ